MPLRILLIIASFFLLLASVRGVKPCQKVTPPGDWHLSENCSVVCSSHLLNYVSGSDEENEIPLCAEDSSALGCTNHEECRKYYVGAACKKIPCACEGKSGSHFFYILDPKFKNKIPSLKACTVSLKWLNPDDPIVPFPWKTLLVVFVIIGMFVVCLITVRWMAPCIRAMRGKCLCTRRTSQNQQQFTAVPLQEIGTPARIPNRTVRAISSTSQRLHSSHRRNVYNQFFRSLRDNSSVSDKPPPYEVAIQEPPTYEEYEQLPLNSPEVRSDVDRSSRPETQNRPQNVASVTSISTI